MPPGFHVVVLLASLPFLSAVTGQAATEDIAPIMPLAASSLLLDIATAGKRLVVVGERGHILYSDDNGSQWQQARVPTTQMLTGVDFVDDQKGWAVGHDGLILVSDDGGENWRVQRDGLAVQHQINLELREAAHRKLSQLERALESADGDAREDVALELEDARMDLEDADLSLEEPVFTAPFMDVWFQDADRGWAVGAFGTVVATRDGGQHWVAQTAMLDNPDEFHLNTITGDGKGRVFIGGEGGVMFRSVDSGATWESLAPFYEGSWFGAVYDAGHGALLLFGLRGHLFRSSDFGSSWEPVLNDNNNTLAGGSVSEAGEIVLVGGVGTVLRSSDGGQSFQRTMMADRLSLSSGLAGNGSLVLVGQGGVKILEDDN